MGPNIDIAVANTAPRGAAGARAAQPDTPPPEPFDTLLDRQTAAQAKPDGRPQKRQHDLGDVDASPADVKDQTSPQNGPIVPPDPAWQALLAQVLSSDAARQPSAAPAADAQGRAQIDEEAAPPQPDANEAIVLPGPHAQRDSRARVDVAGTAQPNAADAAFMAAALAADRKLGKDGESVVSDEPQASKSPGDTPDALESRLAPQTGDARMPGAHLRVDSQDQSGRRSGASFAGMMEASAAKAGDSDDPRAVTVRHVDMQTHYPVTGEPMSQVASHVSAHLAGDVKETAQTPAAVKDPQQPLQSGTKVLNIQLEPEALGSVNVRMRLSGDRLTIELDVSQADTLEMISRSQDSLHKSLAKDNVHIDSLTIRQAVQVDPSSAGQGASNQNSGQNGSFPQQQAQQQGTAYSGERPRGQRDADRQGKSRDDESAPARDRGAAANGIYM